MPYQLRGKIVEQVGVLVVRDVVEIDQSSHQVIFQPKFLLHIAAEG